LELIQDGRNDFRAFYELIQNSNIFFNMYDAITGNKIIANGNGICIAKSLNSPDDVQEYYIGYRFRARDTKQPGTYIGQFTIEFLDGSGTLITPIREELKIQILAGTIKK
jgi:hypothetical protein